MKTKIILIIVFTLLIQLSNAQQFGLKGGVNLADVTITSLGVNASPSSLMTSFQVGPVVDFEFSGDLFFNTGLLYTVKGFNFKTGSLSSLLNANNIVTEDSLSNETLSLNYLEVPLNLKYKFSVNKNSNVFIQGGPYLGYGISGKDKSAGISVNAFSKDSGLKRFDYGIGLGAGLEFGAIITSINYEFGLANLISSANNDPSSPSVKMTNKVLQVSLAYMFGNDNKSRNHRRYGGYRRRR